MHNSVGLLPLDESPCAKRTQVVACYRKVYSTFLATLSRDRQTLPIIRVNAVDKDIHTAFAPRACCYAQFLKLTALSNCSLPCGDSVALS